METRTLKIPYPEDLPETLGSTPEQFEREIRFLVAAKLYEMGRISSGRAAELAGWKDWAHTGSPYSITAERNWNARFGKHEHEQEKPLEDRLQHQPTDFARQDSPGRTSSPALW